MVMFGQKIRSARQAAGLSQQQAAEIFGVSSPMVSMYENDHSKPGLERLEKFAAEAGKSFAWFFLAEDEEIVSEGLLPAEPTVTPEEALEVLRAALFSQKHDGAEPAASQLAELRAENAALKKELEKLRARAPSRKFGQDKNHTPPRKSRGSDQKQTGS